MSSDFWPHALMAAVGFLAGITSCWYDSVSRTRPVSPDDITMKLTHVSRVNDEGMTCRVHVYGAISIPVIGGGDFEMVDIQIDLDAVSSEYARKVSSDELSKVCLKLFKRCEGQRVLRRSLG